MVQIIILALAVFVDYLSRLERFLNADITLWGAAGYILLKVPYFFVQFIPASILLSAVTLFGLMNRNNELLAIKSSGISVYHLIKPVVAAGLFLATATILMNETLVPATMSQSNAIKFSVIKKQEMATSRKDIWVKSGSRFIHINYFDVTRKKVSGITIAEMGSGFQITQRIDAKSGEYRDKNWYLEHAVVQKFDHDSADYQSNSVDMLVMELDIKPEDLVEVVKKPDEMTYRELKQLMIRVENDGYDVTRYRVDLHGKIAFPFICLIMAITGAAVGMRARVRENLPLGIGFAVVIAFSYWVVYGFGMSLGYGNILPPVIAAWAANFIFLCLGVIFLINVE